VFIPQLRIQHFHRYVSRVCIRA